MSFTSKAWAINTTYSNDYPIVSKLTPSTQDKHYFCVNTTVILLIDNQLL